MTLTINLPDVAGALRPFTLETQPIAVPAGPFEFNRIAFSAVHVVADPFSASEPGAEPAIDWDATIAFRRHILDLGLGVAEAMDTAQRGMGLDWPNALALIQRTLAAADPAERDRIFSGVGTDHLDPGDARSPDHVVAAYCEQLSAVQGLGGRVIVMASRALARVAAGPEDYVNVYRRVLAECDRPVILHWLGDMFDPQLSGYWGADAFEATMETALQVIGENADKIDGIKISLLDDEKEIVMRRRLPASIMMYTGDDFNYPDLIAGDDHGFSHALLGIFDPIAPAASAALAALAAGDRDTYDNLLRPTVPLSRLIFRAPTHHYKTGVVFLAYLNGFQDHFVMIGGAQSMRPLPYFTELFRLAEAAGLLRDPEDAVARMKRFLALYGVEA
jgi:hypothetical protein